MKSGVKKNSRRRIATWLFAGVFMLLVQIMLGGITRLTESGLSITDWKPITGVLPPLNQSEWMTEFDRYKQTDQYRYMNSDFNLSDFKSIFFWEWFHRNWARLMGMVFLVGFFYFLGTRQFERDMVPALVILFLLGIMQAIIGWIMVKSGLIPERMFVGHIQLATHFMAAMVLVCYTWWFALSLAIPKSQRSYDPGLRKTILVVMGLLCFQLLYGAFMAGLHAATAAPTWPSINGMWIPSGMFSLSPGWKNFIDNKITVQFIHRGIAYLLLIAVIYWFLRARKVTGTEYFRKARWVPMGLVVLQVVLGITTVVTSPDHKALVVLGVTHQTVAILFLLSVVFMIFITRKAAVMDT